MFRVIVKEIQPSILRICTPIDAIFWKYDQVAQLSSVATQYNTQYKWLISNSSSIGRSLYMMFNINK